MAMAHHRFKVSRSCSQKRHVSASSPGVRAAPIAPSARQSHVGHTRIKVEADTVHKKHGRRSKRIYLLISEANPELVYCVAGGYSLMGFLYPVNLNDVFIRDNLDKCIRGWRIITVNSNTSAMVQTLPHVRQSFVGMRISKPFDGQLFCGIVVSFAPKDNDNTEDLYHILYQDEDEEDLDFEELMRHLTFDVPMALTRNSYNDGNGDSFSAYAAAKRLRAQRPNEADFNPPESLSTWGSDWLNHVVKDGRQSTPRGCSSNDASNGASNGSSNNASNNGARKRWKLSGDSDEPEARQSSFVKIVAARDGTPVKRGKTASLWEVEHAVDKMRATLLTTERSRKQADAPKTTWQPLESFKTDTGFHSVLLQYQLEQASRALANHVTKITELMSPCSGSTAQVGSSSADASRTTGTAASAALGSTTSHSAEPAVKARRKRKHAREDGSPGQLLESVPGAKHSTPDRGTPSPPPGSPPRPPEPPSPCFAGALFTA